MRSNQASMTRLPELADQVIRRNVSDELEKLKKAPSWQRESGRSSETLVKYEAFRIVLVRMKPGSYMSHHRAEGPISIQLLQGKVRVHLPEDRMEDLKQGDLLTLERCLEHDVEALEESAFLLTIAWPETATEAEPNQGTACTGASRSLVCIRSTGVKSDRRTAMSRLLVRTREFSASATYRRLHALLPDRRRSR